MAKIDYFALDEDFYALLEFVLTETNMVVYEAYSQIDSEIRRVASVTALREMAGERVAGGFLLRGWFPDVQKSVAFRTFKLDPKIGTQRTVLEGASVIQFNQGSISRGSLNASSFSHWNEAGALRRGLADAEQVNWPIMRRYSGRIQRHLRNKLPVAKVQNAVVLPKAYAAVKTGLSLWYGQEIRHGSSLLASVA